MVPILGGQSGIRLYGVAFLCSDILSSLRIVRCPTFNTSYRSRGSIDFRLSALASTRRPRALSRKISKSFTRRRSRALLPTATATASNHPPPLGQMASARCHATRICVHMLGRFNYRYNLLIYLLAHITNRNSIFLLWGLPPSPLAGGLAPTNRYYWGYCPTFLGGYYRTALAPKARAGSTAHKLLLGLPPLNLSWGVVAQKLHLGYCPKLLRWLPTAKDLAGANAQLLLQLLHNA